MRAFHKLSTFVVYIGLMQLASAETMEVTASAARMRTRSSTNSSVLGLVMQGAKVEVISVSGKWAKVDYDGRSGWIHTNLLKSSSEASGSGSSSEATQLTEAVASKLTVSTKGEAVEAVPNLDGEPCPPGSKDQLGDLSDNVGEIIENTAPQSSLKPKPRPDDLLTTPSVSSDVACFNKSLLESAKSQARSEWGNRARSGGQCALGVRKMLQHAKIHPGAGGLGHAIDFHAKGRLKGLGYTNVISKYPSVSKAPAGAILVFSGPNTKQYLRSGTMRKPYGDWVGHVTIKGDDGYFYTDGRTKAAAGKNRTLVGVYVLNETSGLPSKAKQKAEKACRQTRSS